MSLAADPLLPGIDSEEAARPETDRRLCHTGCQGDYVPSKQLHCYALQTELKAMPSQEIGRYLQARYYLARFASNKVDVAQRIVHLDINVIPIIITCIELPHLFSGVLTE